MCSVLWRGERGKGSERNEQYSFLNSHRGLQTPLATLCMSIVSVRAVRATGSGTTGLAELPVLVHAGGELCMHVCVHGDVVWGNSFLHWYCIAQRYTLQL